MTQLLDLIERVVPRVRHYPRWAQRLFAVSFAMVLVSFLLWVVMAPAAAQTAQHSSVKLAIGVGPSGAGGTMGEIRLAAASTHAANLLDDPVTYVLDMSTRTVQPEVPYLDLVRRGGPLGGIEHGTFDWWDAATRLPQLDVKLANTGSTKVYLTAATVHVARSVPDLEPIPIVFRGDMSALRVFELQNEGWGRMEHASLDYGIAAGTSAAAGRVGAVPRRARHDRRGEDRRRHRRCRRREAAVARAGDGLGHALVRLARRRGSSPHAARPHRHHGLPRGERRGRPRARRRRSRARTASLSGCRDGTTTSTCPASTASSIRRHRTASRSASSPPGRRSRPESSSVSSTATDTCSDRSRTSCGSSSRAVRRWPADTPR